MKSLFLVITEKREKQLKKASDIRNKFDHHFYVLRNRTHTSFSELKEFIENRAEDNKNIKKDLEFMKSIDSIYWKC